MWRSGSSLRASISFGKGIPAKREMRPSNESDKIRMLLILKNMPAWLVRNIWLSRPLNPKPLVRSLGSTLMIAILSFALVDPELRCELPFGQNVVSEPEPNAHLVEPIQ